jgi:hypothetical protein
MESEFFGFIEATVRAPLVQTHAGYIGLLPLKYKGRFKHVLFLKDIKSTRKREALQIHSPFLANWRGRD